MRFKLDENMPDQLKGLFTESGHDAETVRDEGLGGAPDVDIASACAAEGRVLITLDLDFADIRACPPGEHFGIVVLRLPLATRDAILGVGSNLIERLADATPSGKLWIVDEARIRIRE